MGLGTANRRGLGKPARSGLSGRPRGLSTLAIRHGFSIGRNPSADLFTDNTSKWAAIDFVVVTKQGGGNRIHARAMNLVGIDPPELVFRGLGPNNTAPFGPGQDGTALEQATLGRGLGRIMWQGLTQRSGDDPEDQGSFQGWAANIGCHAAEPIRADSPSVPLASEVTLGAATPATIEITGNMDSITLNDGEIGSFYKSGQARIGGVIVTYAGRSQTKLFGCTTAATVSTASVVIDPAGDHNKIKVTAKSAGAAGNNITVAYVDPGALDQSLSVGVVGNAITVNLATDSDGNITTTATDVHGAIRADASAAALVNVGNKFINPLSNGSGVVTAISATNLAGGADGITFSAGQSVSQRQIANGGILHFHTSAIGSNSRSDRIRLQPEGSVAIGEKTIQEGITNFFTVQGGRSRFKAVPDPTNFTATVVGTSGATSITYKLVLNTPHDGQTAPVQTTIATAPATLSDTDYIKLTWSSGAGPVTADVLKETSPGSGVFEPIVYRQPFDSTGKWSGAGAAVDRGQAPTALDTIQQITVRNADSGTFRLGHGGGETNSINWDQDEAVFQTRLEGIAALTDNVSVDKVQDFPPSWRVTFDNALAGTDVAKLTLRQPHSLDNTDAADVEDQEDIPLPNVEIRVRQKGGPIAYTLPTHNTTANVIVDGDLDHDGSRVGFYGTAPVAKQTGVAVTAGGIHTALINLGLIAA